MGDDVIRPSSRKNPPVLLEVGIDKNFACHVHDGDSLIGPIDNRALKKAQSWPNPSPRTRGFKMTKIEKSTKGTAFNSGFTSVLEATQQVIVNQKSRDSSAPVVVSVKFMQLRPSMCRWPIGDPQHFETFRFCGSACPSEASYCKKHTLIAHPSSRPGTSRKTNFQRRSRVV